MTLRSALLAGAALWASAPILPAAASEPAPDPADTPPPAHRLTGAQGSYAPWLRFEPGGARLQADFLLGVTGESATAFPVDRYGTVHDAGLAVAPLLRAGIRADSGTVFEDVALRAEYEHDLPTGCWTSGAPAAGAEMPSGAPIEEQLRKLSLRVSLGPWVHAGGGFMTNQFGMGLLANDGAEGRWAPGSARFADPRGGDRVLRGFLGTGPLGPALITATIAIDEVRADDALFPGDEAVQFVGAIAAGHGAPWGGGALVVHRRQEAPDGAYTRATVVDLTARYGRVIGPVSLSIEGEAAIVTGETTIGPTPEHPAHDVRQLGLAARAAARGRHLGGVIDLLYASGDGNPDDGEQSAFRPDPSYEMGLLLYRQVLAAQTGRATVTAGDPALVGVPSPGLERVPTRGSATSTIAVFPRAYARPVGGLEVYGGPLLAWSAAPLHDPLNTRVAGGVPTNALGGASGDFLGMEIDLGARFRVLIEGSELTLGVEGAALIPGGALDDPGGDPMSPVLGGRGLLQYRL